MVDATAIFRQLSFLLLIAVASHFLIKRFRQPTIIGEIAIGIVMGTTVAGFLLNRDNPACFPVAAQGCPAVFDQEIIAIFAALGSIFLLFLIGIESDFRELYTRRNLLVATGGVVFPWIAGFLLALYGIPDAYVPDPANRVPFAVFIGAILVATSTAIAAAILLEMGLLQTRVAKVIMGAAVIDDILGFLVLSIAIGTSRGSVDIWNLIV
ncbi:MAG TPA: cation:proton antiporter, partial [Thermoplasmata archaeon]|nr:cation:proton antiporter [Thermoplasmata archaeon]